MTFGLKKSPLRKYFRVHRQTHQLGDCPFPERFEERYYQRDWVVVSGGGSSTIPNFDWAAIFEVHNFV